jgi:transcriptional regulator with XRE-family HTH domain
MILKTIYLGNMTHPLRIYLKEKNISQRKFAADLGISTGALSNYLARRCSISLETALRIVKLTEGEVSLHSLVRKK